MSHLLDSRGGQSAPLYPLPATSQKQAGESAAGKLVLPPHSLVLPSCPEGRGEPVELAWGAEDVLLFTVVERLQWCWTPLIPAFKRKRQADL